MEIICWTQTPPPVCQLSQGLVMLPPPSHTPPRHPPPLMSPPLFPTVSHLLHRVLFCFTYSTPSLFPFSLPAVVLPFKQSPSDLAGITRTSCATLIQPPTWRSLNCVVVKVLADDYIGLHLPLISCFTVIVVQHQCEESCFDNRKVSYSQLAPEDSVTQLWLCSIRLCVLQCGTLWGNALSQMTDNPPHGRARTKHRIEFHFWWHGGRTMWKWKRTAVQLAFAIFSLLNPSARWECLHAHLRARGVSPALTLLELSPCGPLF